MTGLIIVHLYCCFHITLIISTLPYHTPPVNFSNLEKLYLRLLIETMGSYCMKYKEFRAFESFDSTPFVEITGISKAFIRPKRGEDVLRPITNHEGMNRTVKLDGREVLVGEKMLGKEVLIDRRQYVKVFVEFIDIVMESGISFPGVKMLFFIMKRLQKESDTVRFSINVAKAHTGYKSDKSVYEGLVELMRLGILAKKEGSNEEYFVNPEYIFRGRRDDLI